MRSRTKIAAMAAAIALVFFLAPVAFWYNAYGGQAGVPGKTTLHPVYRSLGCYLSGAGDTYAPNLGGFRWGCQGPLFYL